MRLRAPLVVLLLAGCTLGDFERAPMNPLGGELTIEKEQEVTADVASQIRGHVELVGDPIVLAYLNELGQEIVRVTEPQPFVYRFALLRDSSLNAFTIGGGYVYLNTGVVQQAGDVAELVGVLAHEIAHVRRRHIAKRHEGQTLATLATLAATAAVALGGGHPGLIVIPQGLNVALQLKHSRTSEEEADREGIGYMLRAGYDPGGMTRFFERILQASPSGGEIPPYLYSHPAVRERIARGRAQIQRALATPPPPSPELDVETPRAEGLERDDPRLREIQARLAALLEPVAGGSGLQARAEFDRTRTDPLLERAGQAGDAGDHARADAILDEASELEPRDPRIPLLRADLAERRGDMEAAARALEQAFEIDPRVPLVQHRLGLVHRRLSNRTQSVFYLEQAAANYRPGSAARARAELDIELLSFPLFDESALHVGREPLGGRPVRRGQVVTWSATLASRFLQRNPEIELVWLGPGAVRERRTARVSPLGGLDARLDTTGLAPGSWKLEIRVGGAPIETHAFELVEDASTFR